MKRRLLLQGLAGQGVLGPLLVGALPGAWAGDIQASERTPILVVLEMTGGNDGLNTVVPHGCWSDKAKACRAEQDAKRYRFGETSPRRPARG